MFAPFSPARFSISSQDLWSMIGTAAAPQLVDVRRAEVYAASPVLLPAAIWRDAAHVSEWSAGLERGRPLVLACQHGHALSQNVVATLRAEGFAASILAGGYEAWSGAGLPLVSKEALDRLAPRRPSLWVTRRRPKIDRIACPWLIRRFVDPDARILFVEPDQVVDVARHSGGVPFDIPDVEIGHEGERCSFDTLLRLFGLDGQPELARLALIVRGADTARPDLAPEAAGLHAVSLGLSALAGDDDHGLLARGFMVYDALFAWLRFAAQERHNWPSVRAG
jgi:rhodanese-related sulfurtransferase